MRIIDRETFVANQSSTRTVQNFGTLLREKPEKLGQLVTMKPELSLSMLTDALRNVYRKSKDSKDGFTPINAMAFRWEIKVNYLPKIKITRAISGAGAGGTPVTIGLDKRYYDRNDTFALDNKQTLFVVKSPEYKGPNWFEYTVKLVSSDPTKSIDTNYGAVGRQTTWKSNYHPELSERGYSKFLSNTEVHRNYLSRHRVSVDWSGDYAMLEKVFIADGKKDNETIYGLAEKEKDTLDQYLYVRENHLLFGESNFDVNGKCLLQDEKGRDIPMGDGVLMQVTRVCDKIGFTTLTTAKIESLMIAMSERYQKKTGNTWTFLVNDKFWTKFNRLMANDLRFNKTDGAYLYSKQNGNVKVGATYNAYEFGGNTIVIMIDSALSLEYNDRAYGILLDPGKDEVSGKPNIALFTMEGAEIIEGSLKGMGGMTGRDSGEITTSVHGSSSHLLGYSGVGYFNPYRAVIMEELIAA